MRNIGLVALLCVFSTVALAELSEKIQKKLDTLEASYKAAVDKANNARYYAVQKASGDRVKAMKQLMTEATKSGDLDGATEIKGRIAAAEAEGGIRAKPKNTVKFGGHEYAIIDEKTTWHLAKRHCEEMGGHLVTMESTGEQEFVVKLSAADQGGKWCGASDEESEGVWTWIEGTKVPMNQTSTWSIDNEGGFEHHLFFYPKNGQFMDGSASTRFAYVCEWEK